MEKTLRFGFVFLVFGSMMLAMPTSLLAKSPVDKPLALQLPEWVAEPTPKESGGKISQAFELPASQFKRGNNPAPMPKIEQRPTADDIGQLLSQADDLLHELSPSELVDQLERAAADARSVHTLSRLVRRCHTLSMANEFLGDATPEDRLRLNKLVAWAHDARGQMLAAKGDHLAALADFEQAIESDSRCLSALHNRAVSLAESGQLEAALADFTKLIQLSPAWDSAHRNRSELLLQLGQAEQALKDCDFTITRLQTTNGASTQLVEMFDLRGRILQSMGKPHEAARDFTKALTLLPDDPKLLHHRGNALAQIGYFEQAVEDYLAALEIDAYQGAIYSDLAWVLATCPREELRDPITAVEAARRARRLLPGDDYRMLESGAAAHAAMGDFEEAIRLQQRALLASDPSALSQMRARLVSYEQGLAVVAKSPERAKDPMILQAGHAAPIVETAR